YTDENSVDPRSSKTAGDTLHDAGPLYRQREAARADGHADRQQARPRLDRARGRNSEKASAEDRQRQENPLPETERKNSKTTGQAACAIQKEISLSSANCYLPIANCLINGQRPVLKHRTRPNRTSA